MNNSIFAKGIDMLALAVHILTMVGGIVFAIGLVSFSGYPVRSVLVGSTDINLAAMYLKLAIGMIGCFALCYVTRSSVNRFN